MKMIYPQRDNKRKRNKLAVTYGVIGLVLITVLLLTIFNANLFAPLMHATGKPVLVARGGLLGGINNFWQFLHSKNNLVVENNALKQRLALYDAVAIERDFYKFSNAELLRLTGRIEPEQMSTFARILTKPGFSPYDTMIIDAGRDAVTVGDTVIAGENVILGEVKETYGNSSLVALYSSPHFETHVLIGTKAIPAIATGKGGGNFEIKLPRNTEVKAEDMVIMASSTPAILGKVQLIQTSPTDTFERALFKNAVDIGKISFVMIHKK